MQNKIFVAENGFETKILEAQQEYEENMSGLLEAIAKQDAIILEHQSHDSNAPSAEVVAAKESEELTKIKTMYKAVAAANESSEREVKRLKRMVERGEAALIELLVRLSGSWSDDDYAVEPASAPHSSSGMHDRL